MVQGGGGSRLLRRGEDAPGSFGPGMGFSDFTPTTPVSRHARLGAGQENGGSRLFADRKDWSKVDQVVATVALAPLFVGMSELRVPKRRICQLPIEGPSPAV